MSELMSDERLADINRAVRSHTTRLTEMRADAIELLEEVKRARGAEGRWRELAMQAALARTFRDMRDVYAALNYAGHVTVATGVAGTGEQE